jgi:redox-sensitive bicupin YhaK (pirin superfamily)
VLPWQPDFNALAYVLSGAGDAGAERHPVESGQLVVFGAGDTVAVHAHATHPLDVLFLGGRPIREPVAQYGPFVMNTRAELVQAIEDFNAGRLGTVPADGLRPYRP